MSIEVRNFDALVSATSGDLPPAVAATIAALTLNEAAPGETTIVDAAGMTWATRSWGHPEDPPLLAAHGIMSDGGVYWRLGPALAAAGWRVMAVDLPAHGGTGPWNGRYLRADTAADLAAFIRAADLDTDRLVALGHSWGAAVVANLPAAGLLPRALLLLDPPYLALDGMVAMTRDPVEHRYDSVAEALANLQAANVGWADGDLEAKALALTRFDPEAASTVLTRNGDWDAGLAALSHPNATGVPVWILRGEPRSGCLIPDEVVPALAARVGADHVLTIENASHSPMRTRDPAAVTLAILHALGWQSEPTSGT
jgi:pimeloyl-ACP methyl ester carboxylesterase